mmetsp:Transcript_131109/g.261654  ORF Transcript_131109/g.261654 Transcript_131109/m.261654 type:complete len:186 (-) Transcript_131109:649-1206(-)
MRRRKTGPAKSANGPKSENPGQTNGLGQRLLRLSSRKRYVKLSSAATTEAAAAALAAWPGKCLQNAQSKTKLAMDPSAVTTSGVAPSFVAKQKVVPKLIKRSMGAPNARRVRYPTAALNMAPSGAPPKPLHTGIANRPSRTPKKLPKPPAKTSACERTLFTSDSSPTANAAPSKLRHPVLMKVVT